MNKHILILNTGGTISCVKTDNGYEPISGYVESALHSLTSLKHQEMPKFSVKEYQPLLDSSNLTVNDWNRIAQDIYDHFDLYDGFVIFHGTDTLAYTASALSFMLENLSKPVILTGSQIPLSEVRNDAIDNIITSLWLCSHEPISEVCVYFNQKLLRGNRSQKISAQGFDAFDSPNYPHLASIGTHIEIEKKRLISRFSQPLQLQLLESQFIANFRLFPGFSTDVLAFILNQPIRGLILETYGAGNAPNNDPRFLNLLKEACQREIIIINCTQCQKGRVEMNQYATGVALKKAGLISGFDMTPEASHCKLLYLMSKKISTAQIKEQFSKNLCGELS